MAILNRSGGITVRIRGIDQAIRSMANYNEDTHRAAKTGCRKAAEYLMKVMKEKFGIYQSRGGVGGGAWAKLKIETILKKMKRFGVGDKPLIETGQMRDSLFVKESTTKNALAASVSSNDKKMPWHVYGVPSKNIPPRDLMLVTAVEEKDMTSMIVEDEVTKVYRKYM